LGQFDAELFMFADEFDLSWRFGLRTQGCGGPGGAPAHRGAANVTPRATAPWWNSAPVTPTFFATATTVTLLKNAQHILLFLALLQIGLLAAEAVVGLVLVRRWRFIKRPTWAPSPIAGGCGTTFWRSASGCENFAVA